MKHVLIDHKNDSATVYTFKSDLARKLKVTTKTLSRWQANKVKKLPNYTIYFDADIAGTDQMKRKGAGF